MYLAEGVGTLEQKIPHVLFKKMSQIEFTQKGSDNGARELTMDLNYGRTSIGKPS